MMLHDSGTHPALSAASSPSKWVPLVLCAALLWACGADGTDAPYVAPPEQRCLTLDERVERLVAAIDEQQLQSFEIVLERLQNEREGARLERTLRLFIRVLQAMPRQEATEF